MEQYLVALLCLGGGLFTVFCAAKDYEWFMAHRKARFMSNLLGRKGARIFYILLGSILLLAGAVVLIAGLPAAAPAI